MTVNFPFAFVKRSLLICALFGGLVACKNQKNSSADKTPAALIDSAKKAAPITVDLPPEMQDDYELVWREEFNYTGKPDSTIWRFEHGFVRNHEPQWYQADNAIVKDGDLVITARAEKIKNPDYDPESKDWRKNRAYAPYTSAAIETHGKKEFLFGSIVVRAKIDTTTGAWPAIWTVGKNRIWPDNGEIDILEFYQVNNQSTILANFMWGTWKSSHHKFADFLKKDPQWPEKYHTWRMDWNKDSLSLYLDNQLLNRLVYAKDSSLNKFGENPFLQPQYLRLNLAVDIRVDSVDLKFPMTYNVDYVRYYKPKKK